MNSWDMSDRAQAITSARANWWEYALFAQAVCDSIALQHVKGGPAAMTGDVPTTDFRIESSPSLTIFLDWVKAKVQLLPEFITSFGSLLAADNSAAFGLAGAPGDPEKITMLAIRVGELYKKAAAFSLNIETLRLEFVGAAFGPAATILEMTLNEICDELIAAAKANVQFFEEYGNEILLRIGEAEARLRRGEPSGLDLFIRFKVKFDEDGNIGRAIEQIEKVTADLCAETIRLEQETQYVVARSRSMLNAGYLYLMMNLSMPGLVKIGMTTRTPAERVRELGSATGVPTPFVVAYEIFVEDCHRAERRIHEILDPFRVSENREFFRITAPEAVNAMLDVKLMMQNAST